MHSLLLFSDVHTDLDAAYALVEQAAEVDVVVGAGDFCAMGRQLEATIDILRAIETPTVVVPGNAEPAGQLKTACADWPAATVLHGAGATVNGIPFYGIGGGVPVTPFGDWSWDFSEDEARALLRECPPDAVLVSHSPPYGVADVSSRGEHLGSQAVRETIEEKALPLCVCGHIHGSWGTTQVLSDTPVHNAGPVGTIWNLDVPADHEQ
ncbi:MAG: serine/threonine protein phosphatase [Bacteroidetes bacterium]|jgi:Icc-related predicted phosphoesterase|nr:serine/threonine protein phosphatase [Bacteroidota bacterium]